jgi:hypothetical protein
LCDFAAGPIGVDEAVDLLAVAGHFGGQRLVITRTLGRLNSFFCSTASARRLAVELEQRDMRDDTGEVDRRLDARVAAADHRHALALEQRAVAVRAIGDAMAAVLLLAGNVHLAPARAVAR